MPFLTVRTIDFKKIAIAGRINVVIAINIKVFARRRVRVGLIL